MDSRRRPTPNAPGMRLASTDFQRLAARPMPPFLFTVALYLSVFKDALRIVEYEISSPIPFSAITAVVLALLIAINFSRIFSQKINHDLAIGWLCIIAFIFISAAIHLIPGGLINVRDFFGIVLVQFMMPFAAITSAMLYDFNKYFSRNKNVLVIVVVVLGVAFLQIAYIAVDKAGAARVFMVMFKEGLIAYPLQTAAGEYTVRAFGVFYSAFALALFCTWVVALGIFRPRMSVIWMSLAVLSLGVLAFTFNRNGIVMCVIVIGLRLLFSGKEPVNYWKFAVPFFAAAAFIVAVPIISLTLNVSTVDTSLYSKTSTLASRADTWRNLFANRWEELVLGTGQVQGVDIKGVVPVLVDNFFLQVAFQGGLIALCSVILLMGQCFRQLMWSRRYSQWFGLCAALFVSSLFGFALNIVFFEPVYQFLFITSILSVIGTARGATRARRKLRSKAADHGMRLTAV